MDKKTFHLLLSKETAGTLTAKEKNKLERMIDENAYCKSVYNEFHYYLKQKTIVDVDAKLAEVWDKMESNSQEIKLIPRKKMLIPMWIRAAAVILLILGIGFTAFQFRYKSADVYARVISSGDKGLYYVLDDGTQIWLNKNSTLSYNNDFGKNKREIRLTGEAFFDVTHNPKLPFKVYSRAVNVTVKGTAFNVNSYKTDEVDISLLRGLVAVTSEQDKGKVILLHPNQKLVMKDGKKVSLDSIRSVGSSSVDSIPAEIRWTTKDLVFAKQRFADLAKLMERRYNVSILFATSALKEQHFTGVICNESLIQMLDAMKLSFPFTYVINGKNVIIK
jgi:transmembrane sensor